ncbi:hypothetical protein BJ322DRAFT_500569 [Thelephora terrestris]|uniref:Uncharacterized protein n=1 Tax=Thelephora terrestris TaxID=56493 RepID=A0A9P6L1L3_9AGAM|nr:hypothetical protein BJ322DRAFT_500569 [Thelephora terrestris]
MNRTQDQLDPEIAKEVIALLNRKVAELRSENAELQGRLDKYSVKKEDEGHVSLDDNNTQRRLEEIANCKSELERRPGPGEVSTLERKLETSGQRGQELEQRVDQLNAKLEEFESEKRAAAAIQAALEKEMGRLFHALNERTQEKEAAVAQLMLLVDTFDFRKFLAGGLIALPARHQPVLMTREEKRRFKRVRICFIPKFCSVSHSTECYPAKVCLSFPTTPFVPP